jgi:hypothetical protein
MQNCQPYADINEQSVFILLNKITNEVKKNILGQIWGQIWGIWDRYGTDMGTGTIIPLPLTYSDTDA